MGRQATWRVVAGVPKCCACRNPADEQFIGHAMRQPGSALPDHATVALWVARSLPLPATGRDSRESRQKDRAAFLDGATTQTRVAATSGRPVTLQALVVRTAETMHLDFDWPFTTINDAHHGIIRLGHAV